MTKADLERMQDEMDGDENCYGCLKREAMNDQLDQENNDLKQKADKLAEALERWQDCVTAREGNIHISDFGRFDKLFKKALKEYRGEE